MSNPADSEARDTWASIHRDLPSAFDDYDERDWLDEEDRSYAAKQKRWERYQDELAESQRKAAQERRAFGDIA